MSRNDGRNRGARFLGATVLALLATGCDRLDSRQAVYRPARPDHVLDFASLYRENCSGCHGAEGKLGPAPPLNDSIFSSIVPDTVVKSVITEGRPGTPMPAFARTHGGPLTDDQVKVLAGGLKSHWKPGEPASANLPRYAVDTSASAGDKQRGLEVFARACADCHGEDGSGGMTAGAINNHAFLALISDQCLRRYVITGRPDLGMPDFAGKNGRAADFKPLTASEITDLVALLAHWRRSGSAVEPSKSKTAAR